MREAENKQMSFDEYVKLYRMFKGVKSYDRRRGKEREKKEDRWRGRTSSKADRHSVCLKWGWLKFFN